MCFDQTSHREVFILNTVLLMDKVRCACLTTGWFQGWNDGVTGEATAAYEGNLVNLIKDIRKDWNAPKMPVAIAVSGFYGFTDAEKNRSPSGCTLCPLPPPACLLISGSVNELCGAFGADARLCTHRLGR